MDPDANESALSVALETSRDKPDFVATAHEFLILTKDQKERMRVFEVGVRLEDSSRTEMTMGRWIETQF